MNLERIMSAVRDLENIMTEETGIQNPIESMGIKPKLYDIIMFEYISKAGPHLPFSSLYRAQINGIEYIPASASENTESNTEHTISCKHYRGNSQLEDREENKGKIREKTLFDPDFFSGR